MVQDFNVTSEACKSMRCFTQTIANARKGKRRLFMAVESLI